MRLSVYIGGFGIYTNITSIILLLLHIHMYVTGVTLVVPLLDSIPLLIATVQIKCTAEMKH